MLAASAWALSTILIIASTWFFVLTEEHPDQPNRKKLTKVGRTLFPLFLVSIALSGWASYDSYREEESRQAEQAQILGQMLNKPSIQYIIKNDSSFTISLFNLSNQLGDRPAAVVREALAISSTKDPVPAPPSVKQNLQPPPPEIPVPEVTDTSSPSAVEEAEPKVTIPSAPLPDPSVPVRLDSSMRPPTPVSTPAPGYTSAARRARIQGIVNATITVNQTGDVTHVEIIKDLPMGLGSEAVKTLRKWKFEPATKDNQPISVYFNKSVAFTLQ